MWFAAIRWFIFQEGDHFELQQQVGKEGHIIDSGGYYGCDLQLFRDSARYFCGKWAIWHSDRGLSQCPQRSRSGLCGVQRDERGQFGCRHRDAGWLAQNKAWKRLLRLGIGRLYQIQFRWGQWRRINCDINVHNCQGLYFKKQHNQVCIEDRCNCHQGDIFCH